MVMWHGNGLHDMIAFLAGSALETNQMALALTISTKGTPFVDGIPSLKEHTSDYKTLCEEVEDKRRVSDSKDDRKESESDGKGPNKKEMKMSEMVKNLDPGLYERFIGKKEAKKYKTPESLQNPDDMNFFSYLLTNYNKEDEEQEIKPFKITTKAGSLRCTHRLELNVEEKLAVIYEKNGVKEREIKIADYKTIKIVKPKYKKNIHSIQMRNQLGDSVVFSIFGGNEETNRFKESLLRMLKNKISAVNSNSACVSYSVRSSAQSKKLDNLKI
ncbi:hypothetical protein MHBO_003370, partial [Bonamia ostreae]